jgi:hypothetical protein
MTNKNCGECRHYNAAMFHCEKHDAMAEPHNTCDDFAAKAPPTNGEKIITGGTKALVKFHLLGTCDTCTYYNKEHTSHNDICLCPPDKTCADGIEEWLNAPAESQLNDAIQNLIKDGAKTAIDIHEAAYAPDINDGTMADCVAENAKSGGEK